MGIDLEHWSCSEKILSSEYIWKAMVKTKYMVSKNDTEWINICNNEGMLPVDGGYYRGLSSLPMGIII